MDSNMQKAQKINACQQEKFYFNNNDSIPVEMTINEIINGSEENKFPGILKRFFCSNLVDNNYRL